MKEKLLDQLVNYSNSEYYPMHMPGHKRQHVGYINQFPNPFDIDITEIEGFDNLHNPCGILKDSMCETALEYGAAKTYYLVNGSSCGILSAVSGAVTFGGKILISRNCHKSVYHGVFLNHLKTEYVYPQNIGVVGIQGGLLPEELEQMLIKHRDIEAVLVVSPTYDGVVSDIEKIAGIVHKYQIPLIVDEAHGAHFHFAKDLPKSALDCGADLVIQSTHKTLPAMTQTALLHVGKEAEKYLDLDRLDQYIHIYQTSSPSYIFMSVIEQAVHFMKNHKRMEVYLSELKQIRNHLKQMKQLSILDESCVGKDGVYDLDLTKIVITTNRVSEFDGIKLMELLREKYKIEMESCGYEYVVAITSVCDSLNGLKRLENALLEIDQKLDQEKNTKNRISIKNDELLCLRQIDAKMTIYEAWSCKKERLLLTECIGRVSCEFVYLYPPGIPIIAPGEVIHENTLKLILNYIKNDMPVQGLKDETLKYINVVSKWSKDE